MPLNLTDLPDGILSKVVDHLTLRESYALRCALVGDAFRVDEVAARQPALLRREAEAGGQACERYVDALVRNDSEEERSLMEVISGLKGLPPAKRMALFSDTLALSMSRHMAIDRVQNESLRADRDLARLRRRQAMPPIPSVPRNLMAQLNAFAAAPNGLKS